MSEVRMRFRGQIAIAAMGLACLFAPSFAEAQTCSAFHPVIPDGKPSPVFTSSATTDHVSFFFRREPDRSYSVEVHNVSRDYRTVSYTVNVNSTNCPISDMAGLRLTSTIEPAQQGAGDFVRYSFTSTASGFVQFRGGATTGTFDMQATVYDTTLFSNWFFLGGDYSAFTLVRNTTSSAVNYKISWRNAGGAIVASTTGAVAANGSVAVNGGAFAAAVAAVSGTVEITHDAPVGGLVASTTVLSGTTGLSFDAPFQIRPH
jgi:hypothetical protein